MSSLAKALQIKEITIDGNPVTLNTDYISFLVSYLPNLQLLSTMQISEQIRRTAMAWRFSKEQSNSTFLDLSTQVCMSVRREEVISNAKTNWEFLRSRTKVSLDNSNKVANDNTGNNINTLLRTQSSNKFNAINSNSLDKVKIKGFGSLTSINENMEARKMHIKKRSNSSENLFKLEDTSKSYPLEFKLPPILGSIVNSLTSDRFENRLSKNNKENDRKMKVLSDIDIENISESETDSSQSHESLKSGLKCHLFTPNIYVSSIDNDKSAVCNEFTIGVVKDVSSITAENFNIKANENSRDKEALATTENSSKYYDAIINEDKSLNNRSFQNTKLCHSQDRQKDCQSKSTINSSASLSPKTSSVDSCKSLLSDSNISSIPHKNAHKSLEYDKDKDRIKSAQTKKIVYYKSNRAATARAKFKALASPSPPPQQMPSKEREQGKLSTIIFSNNLLSREISHVR